MWGSTNGMVQLLLCIIIIMYRATSGLVKRGYDVWCYNNNIILYSFALIEAFMRFASQDRTNNINIGNRATAVKYNNKKSK